MKLQYVLAFVALSTGVMSSGCGTTASTEVARVDTVFVQPETVYVEIEPDEPSMAEVEAGRFDFGRMWTFDNPPLTYFADEYGVAPDESWFERARLGALRLSNCSASFVSPHGLVMTNHHCARESVTAVSQPGEALLDNGFYARSLMDERPIEDGYADQLISITDVTSEVRNAEAAGQTAAERASARAEAIAEIETRMTQSAGGEAAGFLTEVISLYNGGRYSAYLFKRFDDIRLVQAPDVSIAYFGGDPDNFTYPRYNLDMSFYRVYDDGAPMSSPSYFKWSSDGTQEGDAVFVVGNPGSTNRLQTISQLEYRRDHGDQIILTLLQSRSAAFSSYMAEDPERAEELDIGNLVFSIENSVKANTGILKGLHDPVLMGRKQAAETELLEAIQRDPDLSARFGHLFEEMAELQDQLAGTASELGAFLLNPSSPIYSAVAIRSALAVIYSSQVRAGVPVTALEGLREQLLNVEPYPRELERRLIKARLDDMVHYLGIYDRRVSSVLMGRTTEEVASNIAEQTNVLDTDALDDMLSGFLASGDASLQFGAALATGLTDLQRSTGPIQSRQAEISGEISRARFEVYGTTFPPDATFSLRISDGVVRSYEYNGTLAPAYTTFYGLYDRYHSHGTDTDWDLPTRWANPVPDLDLSTPLNLVTTADIIGGSSGSPLLNTELEIVGLVFDGNIESLPGEFIYTDETARTVAVDSRGIIEALDEMFDADRIVLELLSGELVDSEEEADAVRAGR